MKTFASLFLLALLSIISAAQAQNTCTFSNLLIEDIHSCTDSRYIMDLNFTATDPIGTQFKIYYKALPNGNWTYKGEQSYQQTSFQINAKQSLTYAIYLFDSEDAICHLRDTLAPQICVSPCMADSLELSNINCYPGSNLVEIRFDFPSYSFNGGFLFEVLKDSVPYTSLWMAPWGKIMVPRSWMGDTIELCQTSNPSCCASFVIPECTMEDCPIYRIDSATAVRCENGKVRYEIDLQHYPALNLNTTEIDIFDESGNLVHSEILQRNQNSFHLWLPESPIDRYFTVCDFYQVCCLDLILPAKNCQNNCQINSLSLDEVHSCTHTTYIYELSFQVSNPISSNYKIYYKALPNGNWTYAGIQSYQDTSFQISAKTHLDYALYLFDAVDASCHVRDTIPAQDCMPPCRADSLKLSNVRCYPGSDQIEIRFDYPSYGFRGSFWYDVFQDTNPLTTLSMAPWGKIVVDQSVIGDTLTLCQRGDPQCCTSLVVPDCLFKECPLYAVTNAEADTCINGNIRYQISIEHSPFLENRYTEIDIFDDGGRFVHSALLGKEETHFTLDLPESKIDRKYTICDVYQVCCYDLDLPAADCKSLLSSRNLGVRRSLSVFPNPVRNEFTIQWPSSLHISKAHYAIKSMDGKTVQTGVVQKNAQTIMADNWMPGLYILELVGPFQDVYQTKIMRVIP